MSGITITLTAAEIELLGEALDSYEYWEHRDELPHDSGYITIENEDDFEAQVKEYHDDERESMRVAWDAVKASRALQAKLHAARQEA